jgi:hypothetical protein
MTIASSCLFGDLVWASKFPASRARCHWMLNPQVFCAIKAGSGFQTKQALSTCAQFVASNKRGQGTAPFLHHTWLRVWTKSSETRAILLLVLPDLEHLPAEPCAGGKRGLSGNLIIFISSTYSGLLIGSRISRQMEMTNV